MARRDRTLFLFLAAGIVLTLAVSLFSLASFNTALASALLADPNGLPNSASVVNTSSGLRLILSMNQSSLASGEGVVVNVDVQNILSVSNRLDRSNNWKVSGLRVGPCGALGEEHPPLGLAVLHGYYAVDTLWIASRLDLNGPGVYLCPFVYLDITSYVFSPNNDTAAFYNGSGQKPIFTAQMRLDRGFAGYYSGGIPFISSTETFHAFPAGVYTLLGGDEWGDLAVLHFVVTAR